MTRQLGKPCVVSCIGLTVDVAAREARLADVAIGEGEWISVDGDNGCVYLDRRDVAIERPDAELAEFERWRVAAEIASR